MTKIILLLTVGLLFRFFSVAQNYPSYYLLCNKADSLQFLGQKEAAFRTYNQAFQMVSFVHTKKLQKAYLLAIELRAYNAAFDLGRLIIRNSGQPDLIKVKNRRFKRSSCYQSLKDSSAYYLEIYHNRINHDFVALIDSLIFIDQYIIRGNKTYKAAYQINLRSLPLKLFDLDSSNWQLLYSSIQKWGFPSEENIGYEANQKVWAILHHNLRLIENEKYHAEIFNFVESGAYLPEDLVVWYEQFQQQNYNQTYFTTWDGNLSTENLERIENNLRRFYLKGLCAYELRKGGRYMIAKW